MNKHILYLIFIHLYIFYQNNYLHAQNEHDQAKKIALDLNVKLKSALKTEHNFYIFKGTCCNYNNQKELLIKVNNVVDDDEIYENLNNITTKINWYLTIFNFFIPFQNSKIVMYENVPKTAFRQHALKNPIVRQQLTQTAEPKILEESFKNLQYGFYVLHLIDEHEKTLQTINEKKSELNSYRLQTAIIATTATVLTAATLLYLNKDKIH